MKVVHRRTDEDELDLSKSFNELIHDTQLLEKDESSRAILMYEKIIRLHPRKEAGYDRLMIVLRKQKESKKELQVVEKAIRTFHEMYGKPLIRKGSVKVTALSKAIARSTGLVDRKHRPISALPQPLARWQKRKDFLLKKTSV